MDRKSDPLRAGRRTLLTGLLAWLPGGVALAQPWQPPPSMAPGPPPYWPPPPPSPPPPHAARPPMPPPPRAERRPSPPRRNMIWQGGEWRWNGYRYDWIPGRWVELRRPDPRGRRGRWVPQPDGGYIWLEDGRR